MSAEIGEQTIHNQPCMGLEYTASTSSVGMDGKSTPKSSSAGMAPKGCTQAASKEDMVEVVVCTKPGGKEALAQGKFTQAGNKVAMVEG